MGRLTEAAAAEPPRPGSGPECGVVKARRLVDEDDRAMFDDLLMEVMVGSRTAASLSRILGRAGVRLKGDRISYHVRGECKCQEPQP